jgi:hypothetical protein
MKTHSFKLFELINLEAELAGVVNPQTGEQVFKGLLQKNILITDKYWLNDLVSKLGEEKKAIESLREELIKKHGTEDANGNIGISMFLDEEETLEDGTKQKKINPVYIEFNTEYGDLLHQEKEFKVYTFPLKNLEGIKADETYPLVFKYLVESPEVVEEVEVEEL